MKKVGKGKKMVDLSSKVRSSAKRQLSETNQPWNRYLALPAGMEQYRVKVTPENKKTVFRILPYFLTDTRNNPDCTVEDGAYYKRRFFVHKNIGPQKLTVTCPLHTFGKECPICDEVARMRRADDEYSEEDIKSMNAKEQAIYFVMEKGSDAIKVLCMSTFLFDEKLTQEIDDEENGEDVAGFANLEGGKWLSVRWKESESKKFKCLSADSIKFLDAPDLDESVVEKLDLDALLVETSAEDLEKLLEGTTPGYEPPKKDGKKASAKKDADEDEEESDDEEDEDEEEKKPAKGKKAPAKKASDEDEEEDDEDEEDDEESEDEEDDEEEEAPAKKGKKAPAKKASDDEDEDEEDDEESEDDDDEESDEDEEDDEDEEEEEKPVKGKKAPAKKSAPADEDDDEDEDEEDGDDDDDEESDDDDEESDDDDEEEDDEDEDEDEKPKGKKAPAKKPAPAKKAPAKRK